MREQVKIISSQPSSHNYGKTSEVEFCVVNAQRKNPAKPPTEPLTKIIIQLHSTRKKRKPWLFSTGTLCAFSCNTPVEVG
jgi:hypothetical protein